MGNLRPDGRGVKATTERFVALCVFFFGSGTAEMPTSAF